MTEIIVSTLAGAVVAALGFVGKQLFDAWSHWKSRARERLARLAALQSLLLASRAVFLVQCDLRDALCRDIQKRRKDLGEVPFNDVLERGYVDANESERTLHGLIRQYTVGALKPLNTEMRDWLRRDSYFKVARNSRELRQLAAKLRTLEAHLVLWLAKYDFWIPDHPERALVYLDDESRHGVGFPSGIEALVAAIVNPSPDQRTREQAGEEPGDH